MPQITGPVELRNKLDAGGIFIRAMPQITSPVELRNKLDAGGIFIRAMPQITGPVELRNKLDAGGIFMGQKIVPTPVFYGMIIVLARAIPHE